MAKMSYSKPGFAFHAIPLVVGGGTGCFYELTSQQFVCPVYDEDLEGTIFSNDSCDYQALDGNLCYSVPMADHNIYNS